MLSLAASLLIKRGIPLRFARPLIYAVLAALLIGGLGIAKCRYDRNVIEEHDAKRTAETATAARTASEAATAKSDSRNAQEALRRAEIAKDVEHAKQDPESNAPAGPASRAYLERLRKQQTRGD